MPTLYITEFSSIGVNERGGLLTAALVPSLADQTVAIGAASVRCNAFNTATRLVRLTADSVCSVKFGTNPTASATTMRLEAGAVEYFAVQPGAGMKLAVIQNV